MRFSQVQLLSPFGSLPALEDFYVVRLGFEKLDEEEFGVNLGETRLGFRTGRGRPFYHFALLLPGDRFAEAVRWIGERTGSTSRASMALLRRPRSSASRSWGSSGTRRIWLRASGKSWASSCGPAISQPRPAGLRGREGEDVCPVTRRPQLGANRPAGRGARLRSRRISAGSSGSLDEFAGVAAGEAPLVLSRHLRHA
jgi:hypothetical protein